MKQFFSEKGLTATSANHLANIAKELIREEESFLNNLSFLDAKVSLLSGDSEKVLRKGLKNEHIPRINEGINNIAKMSSFIAWVREAIKKKTELTNAILNLSLDEYARLNEIELPTPNFQAKVYDNNDIMETFNTKELNEYYSLETTVAKIGQLIHPNGSLSNARKEMIDKSNNPISSLGSGSETLITTYSNSADYNFVNDMYISLQNKHRELNARLNQIKYKIEQTVQQKNSEERNKFNRLHSEYSEGMALIRNTFESYKAKKLKEIQELKIIIPLELEETFKLLNNIGK